MTKKNILLVGGSNVPAVCRAASRRGLNIIAVNFPESFLRVEPDPAFIHIEGVDFTQVMPTVRRLMELHAQLGFVGVVAVSEFGLLPAAMVARQLSMPGTPLAVVQNVRDKVRMRRTLEEKGLGQVRFRGCSSLVEAQEFFDGIGGPIIVKPVMGTGSDGVSRVDEAGQLDAAWQLAGGARAFGGVICEEYIDGPEVSVEAYMSGGRFVPVAITDKRTNERFLETGHSQPTLLSAAVQEQIFAATHDVLRGLGVTDAVTHTEMRLSSKGPVLIETHTRMGGDFIDVLTYETTGVDLGDVHVALALGETPDVRPRELNQGAAVRFVTGGEGTVTSVQLPKADAARGVHEVRGYAEAGDRTTGRSSSLDRLGHVITVCATRAEADRLVDEVVAECRFVIDASTQAAA
ncbi:MAG: ATP-grasp domain-containing protein [Acidobacteriota bacterium]